MSVGKKEVFLCKPCAEKRKKQERIRLVRQERDMKNTCEDCKRRRFGAVYSSDSQ